MRKKNEEKYMIGLMEDLDKRFKRHLEKHKHIKIVKGANVRKRWKECSEKNCIGVIYGERYLTDFLYEIDFSQCNEIDYKRIEEYISRYEQLFKRKPVVFHTSHGFIDSKIQYIETKQSTETIFNLLDNELCDRLGVQLPFISLEGLSEEEWLKRYLVNSKSNLIYGTEVDEAFDLLLKQIVNSFNAAARELQNSFDSNGIPPVYQMSDRVW